MNEMEDRNSLFTEAERNEHIEMERGLIPQAKCNNFAPLLNFWKEKRALFMRKAFERIPYAKEM